MSCCDAKGGTPAPAKQAPSNNGAAKGESPAAPAKRAPSVVVINDGAAAANKNESLIEPKEVPLSLSSLAHVMCLPRDDDTSGVLEGLLSVVHHTLCEVSCHSTSPIHATPWTLVQTMEKSPFKGLPYTYVKHSYLYSAKDSPKILQDNEDWAVTCEKSVVGRISLYYASSDDSITEDDDEDMQQGLLTRALVEYRSQPSKGSSHARKQEELSLTSFGNGSVDDNVKLGALSSLYDSSGKYVLKITSVRNMTYVYNVCSSNMASSVLVSRQEPPKKGPPLTRLELSLVVNKDGKQPETKPLSFPSLQLENHFLVWNAPKSAMSLPSQQTLLLEKQGMYINGRLFEKTELLPPSLFGFNLEGVPAWHGRIQDFKMVQQAYATLWQEIMIDARLVHLNIASTLLSRLMNGTEEDEDGDDEADFTTNSECLESQLMASAEFDPVGICAKALATRFAQEFGKSAVPCLSHEVEWFQERMAHKTPVVVPQRVLKVLRRGGYFDLQRDTQEVWFMENVRSPAEGEESKVVEKAMELLKSAGANDLTIMFVKIEASVDPVKHKYMCRYNDAFVQYHVNEAVLKLEKPAEAMALYVAQEYPDGHVLLNLMCPSK